MKTFGNILRWIFYAIIARFIVLFVIGLNVRHKQKLPLQAPAIIVANHNSHLDTLVLASLFPQKLLQKIRPVAAADYFLKNKFLAWFSTNIIGIIPINRISKISREVNPLDECYRALSNKEILLLFPEGSRGEPEKLSEFKKGIAHLAEHYPQVPIVPVFMHGLGKALPKGELILVPFFCDVFIGDSIYWQGDKDLFMKSLNEHFKILIEEYAQETGQRIS